MRRALRALHDSWASVAGVALASVAAVVLGAVGGCGAPRMPTAGVTSARTAGSNEPTGEPRCEETAGKAPLDPLIVEWPSTSRAKLEALAHKGVVVVQLHRCAIDVLAGCHAAGDYAYTALTRKHDRVHIADTDALWANVPLGAASLAATLERAGELNVEMTVVGRWEADRDSIAPSELAGQCAGATHVVTAMVTGAFDFYAGSDVAASGGASVLGAGAGGKTSSTFARLDSDGDARKCTNATLADRTPPDGCGALLRLELLAIGAARAPETACPEKTAWDGKECVRTEVVTRVECPPGATLQGEQCIAPALAPKVAQSSVGCRYGDATDCTMQCNPAKGTAGAAVPGDAASCTDLALMYVTGVGVAADPKQAATLYLRACELGSAVGCNQAGMRLEDAIGIAKDDARAAALYRRACDLAKPDGCTNLGRMLANGWGVGKDDGAALEILTRACNLGDPGGCSNLGFFYVKGRGAPEDRQRGVSLLRKGCLAGNKWGCHVLEKLGEKT